MKKFDLEKENGRSMIEMLGVLAIIGVLSVGGIAGYSKAMMKYRINKTIEQISLITANIRTLYSGQKGGSDESGNSYGKYSGLNNTILQKAKLVPDEMWNSDKTGMENAFGGRVLIREDSGGNYIPGIAFAIDFAGVPEDACIELVTHDWPDDFNVIAAGDFISREEALSPYTADCEASGGGSWSYSDPHGFLMGCKADRGLPISVDIATIGCTCTNNKTCSVIFAAQ